MRWPDFALCLPASAQSYTITDLGAFPGVSIGSGLSLPSYANAINNAGQVTGYAATPGGAYNAFLYSDGVLTDLGSPVPGGQTFGDAINAQGHIAVSTSGTNAYLYNGNSFVNVGPFPNGAFCDAFGINGSDQVTGRCEVNPRQGIGYHAYIYSGGALQDIGTLPGFDQSAGNAINDAGQVTGNSSNAFDYHAFLYSGGQMMALGTLPGYTLSTGTAINQAGDVVGTDFTSPVENPSDGFLYSGGKLTDLNALLGSANSSATGLNDLGQIVGAADGIPFLYSGGKELSLAALLGPGQTAVFRSGVTTTGWQILNVEGINDSGQMVGTGVHYVGGVGYTHAFLMTPAVPEASPLWLMGAGLLPLGRTLNARRRNKAA